MLSGELHDRDGIIPYARAPPRTRWPRDLDFRGDGGVRARKPQYPRRALPKARVVAPGDPPPKKNHGVVSRLDSY